mgnify:FL=1
MHIGNNASLINLTGLESVESITTIISISLCPSLSSLSGLSRLKAVDFFGIRDCPIVSVNALENLKTLNGISIENTSITSLHGLEKLTEIKSIYIHRNENLLSMEGLQNLKSVHQTLSIYQNFSLASIQHLTGIVICTPAISGNGVDLFIINNTALTSLDGLQNINVFNGKIMVTDNALLTDLCELENVLTIGSFTSPVVISNNTYNPTVTDILAGNCSQ